MKANISKTKLKQLVANGKIGEALEALLQLAPTQVKDVSDQIHSLSSNYQKYQRNLARGTLSAESERKLDNELVLRLHMIIDQLKAAAPKGSEPSPNQQQVRTAPSLAAEKWKGYSTKRWWILLSALAVLLSMMAYFFYTTTQITGRTEEPTSQALEWVGAWDFTLHPEKDNTITTKGIIHFEKQEDSPFKGEAEVIPPWKTPFRMNLLDASLSENGTLMKGQWKPEFVGKDRWKFEFRLHEEGNRFNGTSTREGEIFIWKAQKTGSR